VFLSGHDAWASAGPGDTACGCTGDATGSGTGETRGGAAEPVCADTGTTIAAGHDRIEHE
jgi:hypothetical protein